MKYALFLIASLAYGQSELGTSAIRIMPRAADSDTGSVRFVELYSNGSNRIDLRAPQSIHANKLLRLPNDSGTLVADFNSVYGSDTFTITSLVSAGTEASPSDISDGRDLFKFAGYARTGGTSVQAARLLFTAETASPLQTFATVGLTNSGTFKANSYAFEYDKFWAAEGQQPDLGTSAASGRWGILYGGAADFLIPTGSTPAYVTGSFVRTQTLDIYDIGGQNGGWSLTAENEVVNDSFLRITDADTDDFVRFWRKRVNTAVNYAEWYASHLPDTTNVYDLGRSDLRWKKGYFTDIDISGTCTGCGSGTGSAPLDEVKITDYFGTYGGDATCTSDVFAAIDAAIDDLPNGGIVTFPPGCYGVDFGTNGPIINGNGSSGGASTLPAVIFKGVDSSLNPSGPASTVEIRAIGSAPASPIPMIRFAGPLQGGGIIGIRLNADGKANLRYVEQIHHAYARFQNVWATDSVVSPSWTIGTIRSGHPFGACYSRFDQVTITNNQRTGGGGISLAGGASDSDACSNTFTGFEVWYDSNTAGTYGARFEFADNNTFIRSNFFRTTTQSDAVVNTYSSGSAWALSANSSTDQFTLGASNSAVANGSRVHFSWASGGSLPTGIGAGTPYFVRNKSGNAFQVSLTASGSIVDFSTTGSQIVVYLINPGVLFEQYASSASFPKEQTFIASAMHYGVWATSGVSGTGGNTFIDFARDDCYISPCIPPDLEYIWGSTKGQDWGTGTNPPGYSFGHADTGDTLSIYQTNGTYNGAGSIVFKRVNSPNPDRIGRIRSHYFDGMVFSTAASGTLADRWKITDAGHWYPASDATYNIGNVSNRPDQIWAREFRAYTNNAFGAQNHTLYGDNNVNLNLKAYGSAGNDYRPGINFYRSEGTVASPSPIATGDRLGVFAWWYNTGSGSESMSVGARLNVAADSYSAGVAQTSIRFATMDAGGTLADRFTINPSGAATFSSTIDATTINATGSPAYRVSGSTVINASRDIFGAAITSTTTEASSALYVITSGVTRFSASGGGINTYNSGGTAVFQVNNTTGIITMNGSAGVTGSSSCGTGTAIKSLTVSGGIVTGFTCGAP